MSEQYSNEFRDAFDSGMGHCQMTCACGRIHFDASGMNGWTWEGREYERLYEKSMSAPDKYIAQNGSIGHIEVGGYTVVMGCSCDIAAKHEQFIVAYARKIATYLNARAKRIQAEAERVCAKETVTAHAGAVAKESAE